MGHQTNWLNYPEVLEAADEADFDRILLQIGMKPELSEVTVEMANTRAAFYHELAEKDENHHFVANWKSIKFRLQDWLNKYRSSRGELRSEKTILR